MKIQASVRIFKTIELEVDDKFRKLDGWHDITPQEEANLQWQLEAAILEQNSDFDSVSCAWTADTDDVLIEY